MSALIKFGHLHHVNRLVVGVLFVNLGQGFREIFVVNPKPRLAGTLKGCCAKGRSQIAGMYIKQAFKILFHHEGKRNDSIKN